MAKISHFEGAPSGAPQSKQHVFLATPSYTGKLDADYVFSLLYSIERMREEGIRFDHYTMGQNCHVDDSRNSIVRDFLLSPCTDLVFLDADVFWEPEALIKLIQHDRDVVAGVYPKRSKDDDDYPVSVEPGTTLQADEDGLVEVSGAPTGFMKIKRHVLEKMWEANAHRRFIGRGEAAGSDPYTIIFERTYEDGHRWSGDYNFCNQWRKMGGKIFVDPYMYLSHVGEVTFSGTLAHHWKRKHGLLAEEKEAAFQEAVEEIRAGNPTAETWVKLTMGWGNPFAADVELLSACYELAKECKGPILETGTGLTTFVMALANPDVEIHSLEHDPIWGSATRYRMDAIGGIQNVTIHFCPLKEHPEGKWYGIEKFPGVDFALALCDGPPRRISNRAVFYRVFGEQIKDAIVVMDDADDDAAVEPFRTWAERIGRSVSVIGRKRLFAVSAPVRRQVEDEASL